MSTEKVTAEIVQAPYAGDGVVRVEIRRNGIATSGNLVRKADLRVWLADREIVQVEADGQTLDLSDARLDIPPYFEGDRAALVAYLQDHVKYRRRIIEQYKRGQRGRTLDASGRSEMQAVNKAALVDAEQQLQMQQAALAVGL